jgi:hypothetical protein
MLLRSRSVSASELNTRIDGSLKDASSPISERPEPEFVGLSDARGLGGTFPALRSAAPGAARPDFSWISCSKSCSLSWFSSLWIAASPIDCRSGFAAALVAARQGATSCTVAYQRRCSDILQPHRRASLGFVFDRLHRHVHPVAHSLREQPALVNQRPPMSFSSNTTSAQSPYPESRNLNTQLLQHLERVEELALLDVGLDGCCKRHLHMQGPSTSTNRNQYT